MWEWQGNLIILKRHKSMEDFQPRGDTKNAVWKVVIRKRAGVRPFRKHEHMGRFRGDKTEG